MYLPVSSLYLRSFTLRSICVSQIRSSSTVANSVLTKAKSGGRDEYLKRMEQFSKNLKQVANKSKDAKKTKFKKNSKNSKRKNQNSTQKKSNRSKPLVEQQHSFKLPHGSKSSTEKGEEDIVSDVLVPQAILFLQAKAPVLEDIPQLAHDLDKVLFSPGVHFLKDPRTRIFNFTPYLDKIRPYEEFDSSKFPGFVSASKDDSLLQEAMKRNKTYYSSTSSMTLTLIQFYLLLNNYDPSAEHRFNFPQFTRNVRNLPLTVFVEPKGKNAKGKTVYSVTSDKSTDVEILLLALGHCLEALLTTEENEFAHYLVAEQSEKNKTIDKGSNPDTNEPEDKGANIYNYLACGGFLMRSQLDCYDSRLPGNGTFDLKTRAACAIRYDQSPESANTGYKICKIAGNLESFEREYKDLIRTGGLLKYGFQARIGQMDGIFVAYHSVNSFSGFQYLPLSEIDKVFFSDENLQKHIELSFTPEDILKNDNIASYVAENQFKVSLTIWQKIMNLVAEDFKGTEYENLPYRLVTKRYTKWLPSQTVHKSAGNQESFLRVFAIPLVGDRIDKLQNFPSRFKTSFRENLTAAERLENLTKAEEELNALNMEVVEDVPILCYQVRVNNLLNPTKNCHVGKHPYPRGVGLDHGWKYRIQRENGEVPVKERYGELMRLAASVLTMGSRMALSNKGNDITHMVRRYGEVGRLRDEEWENQKQKLKETP